MAIRQPIVSVLGHVDHGKTSLLDAIRGTVVAAGESGGITQHIGASQIPKDVIKKLVGDLLEKFKIEIVIPGLLFIDTPGHEAFTTLRKRGGSAADLAILVVDINEGFQQQTEESVELLKQFKVPFIVAATKIDRIAGWFPNPKKSFLETIKKQRDDVVGDFENKLYRIVAQLSEKGFDSERFDRINNFTKQIAIVPCSGKTGEGIAEILLMLSGLSQQFLKGKLELSDTVRGSVLEVKNMKGLGTTIDVILYDGVLHKGDYLVIGGPKQTVTKVRSLLIPRPLQELRVEKQFVQIEKISAAAGIKISALGLDEIVAGSPIISVRNENELESAKKIIQKEVEQISYVKQEDGIIVRADTLGSLEAMIKLLGQNNIPISKAEVGNVNRQDIIEAQSIRERLNRVIFLFNQKSPEDVSSFAKDVGVKIFENTVIYRIIEEYLDWKEKEKEAEVKEKLENVTHPCEIKILKGTVFRQSNPAVFGVEVVKGILKSGVLMKKGNKNIDRVKEIQKEGHAVDQAKKGDKVAVSMENVTVGRQVNEGDVLHSAVSENDLEILKELVNYLSDDEKELLNLIS